MDLKPLHHRLEHDTLEHDGVLHRPDCPHAPADAVRYPAGTVLERVWAPRACQSCWPDTTLLLSRG